MQDPTEGQRIYAIGDIHGCLGLLEEVLARIERDAATRPHPNLHLVFLGDYIDRGPDSRGVIEALIGVKNGPMKASFLLGNHDNYLVEFVAQPGNREQDTHWFHPTIGGAKTVESYGVTADASRDVKTVRTEFGAVFPRTHGDFLRACKLYVQIGKYLFVHAGIKPGVDLKNQKKGDLIWIRDEFLSCRHDFGFKVVHGHTIVPEVQHHRNRIALDTGAVKSGNLSCLVLEEDDVSLLGPDGLEPCPVGYGLTIQPRGFGSRVTTLLQSLRGES